MPAHRCAARKGGQDGQQGAQSGRHPRDRYPQPTSCAGHFCSCGTAPCPRAQPGADGATAPRAAGARPRRPHSSRTACPRRLAPSPRQRREKAGAGLSSSAGRGKVLRGGSRGGRATAPRRHVTGPGSPVLLLPAAGSPAERPALTVWKPLLPFTACADSRLQKLRI